MKMGDVLSLNGDSVRLHSLEDNLDHLIPNPRSLGKPWFEVLLDPFKAVLIRLEVAEGDAFRPSASGEGKLQIVAPEGMVFDGGYQNFVQKARFTEEVFGDAKPEAEKL